MGRWSRALATNLYNSHSFGAPSLFDEAPFNQIGGAYVFAVSQPSRFGARWWSAAAGSAGSGSACRSTVKRQLDTVMTEAQTPDCPIPGPTPDFAAFYRAINGRDPFPWQTRLADQVAANEVWPAQVGVPTGLGKTACLDIAVWWACFPSKPRTRTSHGTVAHLVGCQPEVAGRIDQQS